MNRGDAVAFEDERRVYGIVLASSSSPFVAILSTDGHLYRVAQLACIRPGETFPGETRPFGEEDVAWVVAQTQLLLDQPDATFHIAAAVRSIGKIGLLRKLDGTPNVSEERNEIPAPLRLIDRQKPEKSGYRDSPEMTRYLSASEGRTTRYRAALESLARRSPAAYRSYVAHIRIGMGRAEVAEMLGISLKAIEKHIERATDHIARHGH